MSDIGSTRVTVMSNVSRYGSRLFQVNRRTDPTSCGPEAGRIFSTRSTPFHQDGQPSEW